MKNFFLLPTLLLFGIGCAPVARDVPLDIGFQNQPQQDQGIAVGEFHPDAPAYTRVDFGLVDGIIEPFDFTAEIPSTWLVEVLSEIESVNIYDPNIAGVNNLEKSQIFVRYFQANDFLTLNTVSILNKEKSEVNGRSTVTYDILKKADVENFRLQPSWRNGRHLVTDMRVSDSNPSVFYVFGRRPDLDEDVFGRFLKSLRFSGQENMSFVYPIDEFEERVTKKPFGIFIEPATSPVQPERFSGYHTGVDIEYGDAEDDVPVRAIAEGVVVRSGFVSGYGGMVAVRHEIRGEVYVAIYGHLDSASLVSNGSVIREGQKVGILGDAFSSETDGERKHLHFAVHRGNLVNVSGYVESERELGGWVDPVEFLGF